MACSPLGPADGTTKTVQAKGNPHGPLLWDLIAKDADGNPSSLTCTNWHYGAAEAICRDAAAAVGEPVLGVTG